MKRKSSLRLHSTKRLTVKWPLEHAIRSSLFVQAAAQAARLAAEEEARKAADEEAALLAGKIRWFELDIHNIVPEVRSFMFDDLREYVSQDVVHGASMTVTFRVLALRLSLVCLFLLHNLNHSSALVWSFWEYFARVFFSRLGSRD